MAGKQTLEEMMFDIKVDMAGLKTDVKWLKKLFTISIVGVGLIFGVDMTGVVV